MGCIILGFLIAGIAHAAPASLTYQGRIVKADGQPLQNANVSFLFEITNPTGTCVLYREQVNGINMLNSNGVFDVRIGQSHSYPSAPEFTVLDSFNNSAAMTCAGGASYTPLYNDGRVLRVQFYDGTQWRVISPDAVIRSVPYAAYSHSTNRLGNHFSTDYVLKNEINGNASCGGGSFLTWNATTKTFGCALGGGGGSPGPGSVTEVISANSYLSVTDETTTPTLTVNVGTVAGTVAAGNDPRFSNARPPTGSAGGDLGGSYPHPLVTKIQGLGIDFTSSPTAGQVLTFDGTNWISSDLPASGTGSVTSVAVGPGLTGGPITTTGSIGLGASLLGLHNIATLGYIQRTGSGTYATTPGSVSASNNNIVMRDGSGVSQLNGLSLTGGAGEVTLTVPSIVTTYSLNLPAVQGAANQVLVNDGSGQLNWVSIPVAPTSDCGTGNVLTYAGGAFACVPDQVGSAGGGVATLNGQTGSSQSFGAPGTSGLAPHWVSATDVHTLNIPMASAPGVTAGLLSKAQYDAFAAKQNALSFTPLNPANNLSELAGTVATARMNLGLGTAAVRDVPTAGDAASEEVVLGGDARLTNSRPPAGGAGGDLSGTYPNPTVARLRGQAVTYSSLASGQFLKYDGGQWVNSLLTGADIPGFSDKVGKDQIATCSAAQTLSYVSATDTWSCQSIALADSAITYGSKSARTFLAAPTGGAGVPTFRTIATTDLPSTVSDALWTAAGGNISRSSGYVGIGTATPNSGLNLVGTGGSNDDFVIDSFTDTQEGAMMMRRARGTSAVPTPLLSGDRVGLLTFRGYNGSTYTELAAITSHAEADIGTTQSGHLRFITREAGSSAERMRISASGNVGIGTVAPEEKLHIQIQDQGMPFKITDASASGGRLILGDGTNTAARFQPSFLGTSVGADRGTSFYAETLLAEDTGTLPIMSFQSRTIDGTTAAAVTTRPLFQWRNHLNSVMTILPNGSVGIATTAPTGHLSFGNSHGVARLGSYATGAPNGSHRNDVINLWESGESRYGLGIHANTLEIYAQEARHIQLGTRSSDGNGVFTPNVTLLGSGNLGVGTQSPAVLFHVQTATAGATVARFQSGTGSCNVVPNTGMTCSSDERLKEDIKPIPYALEKLDEVEGVTFKWKDRGPADESRHMGFIAQKVERVAPELVLEDDRGFKQVNYANFVALLTEALKDFFKRWSADSQHLHSRIESLQKDLNEEREQNKEMRQYLCAKDPTAPFCVK